MKIPPAHPSSAAPENICPLHFMSNDPTPVVPVPSKHYEAAEGKVLAAGDLCGFRRFTSSL